VFMHIVPLSHTLSIYSHKCFLNFCLYKLILFFFFAGLGFQLKASYLLGRCSCLKSSIVLLNVSALSHWSHLSLTFRVLLECEFTYRSRSKDGEVGILETMTSNDLRSLQFLRKCKFNSLRWK
jgi:hypothetical protein